MDKSYILSVIRDFAEERLRVESSNWYWAHDYIQLKSYQKWAVKEIMKCIVESEAYRRFWQWKILCIR